MPQNPESRVMKREAIQPVPFILPISPCQSAQINHFARRRKMKMIVCISVILFVAVSAQASVIFEDDFEDGTLNKWTIDGRQQGANLAEVAAIGGSKAAHLQHIGLTEVTIGKSFTYDPLLNFAFDMKSVVSSPYGSHSSDYSAGGAVFQFIDASNVEVGRVVYARSSSDYLSTTYNPLAEWQIFEIEDDNFHSYSLNAADLLSNLQIDYSSVKKVNFYFWAYGSGTSSSLISDVWADNVVVTPEPTTLLLLGLGALFLGKRK
jgi:hypothetical protein